MYKAVLNFESVDEILSATIQMKATEQYFPVVLFNCSNFWVCGTDVLLPVSFWRMFRKIICIHSKKAASKNLVFKNLLG